MIDTRARKQLSVGVIASLLVTSAVLAFLFRVSTDDNPALGRVTYHWSWGRVSRITADADRDGRDDFIARVRSPFGGYSPHTSLPVEAWQSSQCDGRFDVHMLFDDSGYLSVVEWDSRHSGSYDHRYQGAQAAELLRSLKRGESCRSTPWPPPESSASDSGSRP